MPKRTPDSLLPLKHDVLMILLAVAAERRHGYAIMREVETRSEGRFVLQTGALYRTLKRMLAEDLIAEVDPPANADRDDERRRYYAPTSFGRAVLAAEVERMTAVLESARDAVGRGKRPRLA